MVSISKYFNCGVHKRAYTCAHTCTRRHTCVDPTHHAYTLIHKQRNIFELCWRTYANFPADKLTTCHAKVQTRVGAQTLKHFRTNIRKHRHTHTHLQWTLLYLKKIDNKLKNTISSLAFGKKIIQNYLIWIKIFFLPYI